MTSYVARRALGRAWPTPHLLLVMFLVIVFPSRSVIAQSCTATTPVGAGIDRAFALALQPDGKILLAGQSDNATTDIAVVRYNADFTLDASFDTNGIVTTDVAGGSDAGTAVALQPDGKIVVAGITGSDFMVARYLPNGSLDTSFDTDGIAIADLAASDSAQALAIQPDGKIVVVGYSTTATAVIGVVRFNADGSLDTSFDTDGIVTSDITGGFDYGYAVALQSDGKILVAGAGANDVAVVRYNTDGSLDTSFDTDGIVLTDIAGGSDDAKAVLIQTDGKIIAAGQAQNPGFDFAAVRYNPDGTLDTSFDTDGIVTTDVSGGTDIVYAAALQSDGKIVQAGYTTSPFDFAVVRYNLDGSLDTSFDTDGIAVTDNGGIDVGHAVAIQPNGRIILGGYTNSTTEDFVALGYESDGSIATTCVTVEYRSIGTNAGILYNTGTASGTAGTNTVTFGGGASLPLPSAVGAVGTGDLLTLDPGGAKQEFRFILARVSDTEVILQKGVEFDHSGDAYEIRRAYNTLPLWEAGEQGNLVTDNRRAVGVAYKDGPFTAGVIFQGSTTDADRYMHLTVAEGQRHDGTAGTGVVLDGMNTPTETRAEDDYVVIEWLEIKRVRGGNANAAIIVAGTDTLLGHLLIHDFLDASFMVYGIRAFSGAPYTVRNCIIYDGDRSGIVNQSASIGLIENTTIHGMTGSGYGVWDVGGNLTIRNTIAMGNTIDFNGPSTQSYNVSSDATAAGTGSLPSRIAANQFVSLVGGSEDLHLKTGSDAIDVGTDLSSSFAVDIDEERRPIGSGWDMGADEFSAPLNYRSIGTAADYSTGSVSATNGSSVVSGAGTAWWGANRGRGDRITIDAVNYTIESVDSETRLTLTAPFTGVTGSGKAYNIARKFTTLQAWEDCVDNTNACPGVSSPSLIADNRSEVGIVYKESVFNVGVDIDGSITDATHTITLTADERNRHYGIAGRGVVVDGQSTPAGSILVQDDYTVVEWLEVIGVRGGCCNAGVKVRDAAGVLLTHVLSHNNFNGITMGGAGNNSFTARNSIVYGNDNDGFGGDEITDVITLENCTIYGNGDQGIDDNGSIFTVRNTISMGNTTKDFSMPSGGTQCNTMSSDTSSSCDVSCPGTCKPSQAPVLQFVTPGSDFHLATTSTAIDAGADLSPSFSIDIDGALRPVSKWDIGADEYATTTAVDLISFAAEGLDGGVEISWTTGSEIDNLGFHLYRSLSEEGPYERLTSRPIPGLGSSPQGASYRHRDTGVENGTTYFYQLEDIETTGLTKTHGPVSATPAVGATPSEEAETTPEESGETTRILYGDPSTNGLRVLREGRNFVDLELRTEGFYAMPQDDGTVVLEIPGFDLVGEAGQPSMPAKHHWVDAVAGRKVELRRVRGRMEPVTASWSVAAETRELVASASGIVTARKRRSRLSVNTQGLFPAHAARLVMVGFQGETKKALVELAPLRFSSDTGQLFLARRLVVRLSFRNIDHAETGRSRRGRRRARKRDEPHGALVRLATVERGLYGVRYESIFGSGRALPSRDLRLTRQGSSVAFHVEPDPTRFGPGSTLYFVSEGAEANPYGNEAVFEFSMSGNNEPSVQMAARAGLPAGSDTPFYWKTVDREVNRYYQPALVDAPDLWLWDLLLAPVTKSYHFQVTALADTTEPSRLEVALQGTSDAPATPDHHVRIFINGTLLAEGSWNGKTARRLTADIPSGVLREGGNLVAIDNVGDTEASYSTVMLDRFRVVYPRELIADAGELRGVWSESGTASIAGVGSAPLVVDISDPSWPRWLDVTGARFPVEAGRSYLVVEETAVRAPELRRAPSTSLRRARNRADYIVLGPRAFLEEATPLLGHRAEQGLVTKAVAIEDVFNEFGHGESSPEAIRDFLSYAYQHWRAPSPRYVLLLGDASYDYKDYGQTGAVNAVPPLMVKTSYLWTVSDPMLAAVNGDDILPDLAIGRLPVSSVDDVHTMVGKILAWETAGYGLEGPAVLVADDPDRAGNFVADAESAARHVPRALEHKRIYLSELGTLETRNAIIDAFDSGASLMTYIGHGGIHLWADENVFNTSSLSSLAPQSRQPILLTMNCLNGYFHFPYFGSLSEELLKAEGRGVIAAFSPSGLSLNTPAQRLHHAMLDALFSGRHSRLGDAVLEAQAAYAQSGSFPELLSVYHLLGDPALRLR